MTLKREYTLERPPQFSLIKAIKTSFKSIASSPLTFGGLCLLSYVIYQLFSFFETTLLPNTPLIISYPLSLLVFAALCAIGTHIFIQLFSMQTPALGRVHLDAALFKRLFLLAAGFLIIQAILLEIINHLLFVTLKDVTNDAIPFKTILILKFFEGIVTLFLMSCFLVAISFLSLEKTKSISKTLMLSDGLIGRAILGNFIFTLGALLILAPLLYMDINLQFNDRDVNNYYTGTPQADHMMPSIKPSLTTELIKMTVTAACYMMTVGLCAALARQKATYLRAKAPKTQNAEAS